MRAKPNAAGLGAIIATKFVRDLAVLAKDSMRLEDINTAVNLEQSQRIGYPTTKATSCRRRSLNSITSASLTSPIDWM
jgi:hypothetical protein